MDEAAKVLSELLHKMGLEAEVVPTEDQERITLEVRGPETGLVIGKKGQTLDALQYLVNKIVSKKLDEGEGEPPPGTPRGRVGKPIHVDAEGYRSRRAESLVE